MWRLLSIKSAVYDMDLLTTEKEKTNYPKFSVTFHLHVFFMIRTQKDRISDLFTLTNHVQQFMGKLRIKISKVHVRRYLKKTECISFSV